jgi:hypothetical protein
MGPHGAASGGGASPSGSFTGRRSGAAQGPGGPGGFEGIATGGGPAFERSAAMGALPQAPVRADKGVQVGPAGPEGLEEEHDEWLMAGGRRGGAGPTQAGTGVQAGPADTEEGGAWAGRGARRSEGLLQCETVAGAAGVAPSWVVGLGEGDAGAAAALEGLRLKGGRRRRVPEAPSEAAGAALPSTGAVVGAAGPLLRARPARPLTPSDLGPEARGGRMAPPGGGPPGGKAAGEGTEGGGPMSAPLEEEEEGVVPSEERGLDAFDPERAGLEAAAARLRQEARAHAERAARLRVRGSGGGLGHVGSRAPLSSSMALKGAGRLCPWALINAPAFLHERMELRFALDAVHGYVMPSEENRLCPRHRRRARRRPPLRSRRSGQRRSGWRARPSWRGSRRWAGSWGCACSLAHLGVSVTTSRSHV